jgi:hypothetical protein
MVALASAPMEQDMKHPKPMIEAERRIFTRESRETIRRYQEAREKMRRAIEDAHARLREARRWLEAHRSD